MKNTLIIIVVIGLLVFGFIFIKEKQKTNLVQNNPWPETVPATVRPPTNNSPVQNNPTPTQTPTSNETSVTPTITTSVTTNTSVTNTSAPVTSTPTNSNSEYKNNDLGFSFDYPKNLGEINFEIANGDEGKMMFGRLCNFGTRFCMFIGGTTPVIKFPGELNANEVSNFPTTAQLQQLSERGYKNEIKTNKKGEEYVLIYGQKEVDMPFIGEGNMVAIFRLQSSPDFKALGFMLTGGEANTFLDIINSVDIN